jgi:hypothetical protein
MERTNVNRLGRVMLTVGALIVAAVAVAPLASSAEKHTPPIICRDRSAGDWENGFLGAIAPLIEPCVPAATSIPASTPTTTPAPSGGPTTLWRADNETGDFSQWTARAGGGVFISGSGVASISTNVAHSGSHAVQMSVVTDGVDSEAVRLFRWYEPGNPQYPDLYYSVWYYIPQIFQVTGNQVGSDYWNVFQWKSKYFLGGEERTDPTWVLNVGNRPNGAMYFYLYDEINKRSYSQTLRNLPVGKWFHVEAFAHRATDNSGHLTFWQDGAQIFDLSGVQTSLGGELQWSVDSYTRSLIPNTAKIYVDDAVISIRRIGP